MLAIPVQRLVGLCSQHCLHCQDIPYAAQGTDTHRDARKEGAGTYRCSGAPFPALASHEIWPCRLSSAFPPGPWDACLPLCSSGRKGGPKRSPHPLLLGAKISTFCITLSVGALWKPAFLQGTAPLTHLLHGESWLHVAFNDLSNKNK